MAPGANLLVFASDKDRRDPGSELHANFKLKGAGDYLALVRPDVTTIEHSDAPTYPPQFEDTSYGLGQLGGQSTLIAMDASVKYHFPSNNPNDVYINGSLNPSGTWIGMDYDDSGWSSGTLGLGSIHPNRHLVQHVQRPDWCLHAHDLSRGKPVRHRRLNAASK
jgi:hypothetical protein